MKQTNLYPAYLFLFMISILFSCSPHDPQKTQHKIPAQGKESPANNVKGLVTIKTYNHYNQVLSTGTGFFIDKTTVIANLDLVKGSFRVKTAPLGTEDFTDIEGYIAYSHRSGLVALNSFFRHKQPLSIEPTTTPGDSVYSLFRKERQLMLRKMQRQGDILIDSMQVIVLPDHAVPGEAVFNKDHKLAGIVQNRVVNGQVQKVLMPASQITSLIKQKKGIRSVYDLATKSDKTYPSYKTIKGFKIITEMGNIEIRLYNETPEYRDNFIRLVCDQFYDSLLVHRILKGFLIQTGAADTKYAKKGDVVGWQGPGYTLPVRSHPELFHKRGAVAASKLPADRNPKNRCDGSQFYIVSGRIFHDDELDDLEKKNKRQFTPKQREVYTSLGGAPYLDGDYTVFGEVTSGMEVVDRISNVETDSDDRPLRDIRVKKIVLIR